MTNDTLGSSRSLGAPPSQTRASWVTRPETWDCAPAAVGATVIARIHAPNVQLRLVMLMDAFVRRSYACYYHSLCARSQNESLPAPDAVRGHRGRAGLRRIRANCVARAHVQIRGHNTHPRDPLELSALAAPSLSGWLERSDGAEDRVAHRPSRGPWNATTGRSSGARRRMC